MSDQDRISFHNIVENNTWECKDMEFLSECGEQVRWTSEMLSWMWEEKFHIYQQPCIIWFII